MFQQRLWAIIETHFQVLLYRIASGLLEKNQKFKTCGERGRTIGNLKWFDSHFFLRFL
jgi:hypothetical protein